MAYNIKLFIHGVPNGQDIWDSLGDDAKYLEAFYGRKSNIDTQMFVEIMQMGGSTNAYYTYFCQNSNIQDCSNRPGAYFALTLRINYYYKDVRNVYNILEAAFNKYIIGSILTSTANGGYKFLIPTFRNINDHLMSLEKELQHYLMQFSSDKDFVSLSGFNCNSQSNSFAINLQEAASDYVARQVKSNGKVSISSLHPSSKEQQIMEQMNAKMNTIRTQAQQEIADAMRDKEYNIKAIRDEYKDVERTIRTLRAEADNAKKIAEQLNKDKKNLTLKLQDTEGLSQKYNRAINDLKQKDALIDNIRQNLGALGNLLNTLGIRTNQVSHSDIKPKPRQENGIWQFIHKVHPLSELVVMFVLLLIVSFTLPKSCSHNTDDITTIQKELKEAKQEADKYKGLYEQLSQTNGQNAETKYELTEISSGLGLDNVTIDVVGISPTKPMKIGKTYTIRLMFGDQLMSPIPYGSWKSKDFDINGNTIKPKHSGSCIIQYFVGDNLIKQREIIVSN